MKGFLDRCTVSPFADVFFIYPNGDLSTLDGVTYLLNTSNISLDAIASDPVCICFCSPHGLPNCSYQHSEVRIKKGHIFEVSVVALDQVSHIVPATIYSSLFKSSAFGDGQAIQNIPANCTSLRYSITSEG